MIKGALLVGFLITFWYLKKNQRALLDVKQQQAEIKFGVAHLQELLIENAQYNKNIEENTIKALNEICQALNMYFTTAETYMNNNSCLLEHIVVCMIPFMDDVKEEALENEDYEKAQECINIISNLQALLKPRSV